MSLRQNTLRANRLAQLSDPGEVFKSPLQLSFMRTLLGILRQLFGEVVTTTEAAPHILLQSPNGTVYKFTVNDAGALVAVNARS